MTPAVAGSVYPVWLGSPWRSGFGAADGYAAAGVGGVGVGAAGGFGVGGVANFSVRINSGRVGSVSQEAP